VVFSQQQSARIFLKHVIMNENLGKYLGELDEKIRPIDELDISSGIKGVLGKLSAEQLTDEDRAEVVAFDFMPTEHDYPPQSTEYYGPQMSGRQNDGAPFSYPDVSTSNASYVQRWEKRSGCANPILASRYADLVVDFSPRIPDGARADISYYHKVIDLNIAVCDSDLDDGIGCRKRLARALHLAASLNDVARLNNVKDAIIRTEAKHAVDDKPGTWGYAFDWSVLKTPSKLFMSSEEEEALLKEIERRLDVLTNTVAPQVWRAERAARLLIDYYRKRDDAAALESVMSRWEAAFRSDERSNSDRMLLTNYLEHLVRLYDSLQSYDFARKASQRIRAEIGKPKPDVPSGMREISAEIEIKQKDIDAFVAQLFVEDRDLSLSRIAVNLMPKTADVEQQLDDLSQNYPFQFLMSGKIMAEDGYTIATIGSLEESRDDHLIQQYARWLSFDSIWLSVAMDEVRKRYTTEELFAFLSQSAVFTESNHPFIRRMLKAFYEEDHLVVCGIAVPLLEDGVRNIFRVNGLNYLKPDKWHDGFDVMPLHDLLRQPPIEGVFRQIGKDVRQYLQVLLTEKIGWNLRNNFAHGLSQREFDHPHTANRLMHAILLISLVRKKKS